MPIGYPDSIYNSIFTDRPNFKHRGAFVYVVENKVKSKGNLGDVVGSNVAIETV